VVLGPLKAASKRRHKPTRAAGLDARGESGQPAPGDGLGGRWEIERKRDQRSQVGQIAF